MSRGGLVGSSCCRVLGGFAASETAEGASPKRFSQRRSYRNSSINDVT